MRPEVCGQWDCRAGQLAQPDLPPCTLRDPHVAGVGAAAQDDAGFFLFAPSYELVAGICMLRHMCISSLLTIAKITGLQALRSMSHSPLRRCLPHISGTELNIPSCMAGISRNFSLSGCSDICRQSLRGARKEPLDRAGQQQYSVSSCSLCRNRQQPASEASCALPCPWKTYPLQTTRPPIKSHRHVNSTRTGLQGHALILSSKFFKLNSLRSTAAVIQTAVSRQCMPAAE